MPIFQIFYLLLFISKTLFASNVNVDPQREDINLQREQTRDLQFEEDKNLQHEQTRDIQFFQDQNLHQEQTRDIQFEENKFLQQERLLNRF